MIRIGFASRLINDHLGFFMKRFFRMKVIHMAQSWNILNTYHLQMFNDSYLWHLLLHKKSNLRLKILELLTVGEVSPGKSSTNGPKWTRAESEVAGNSCAFRVQGVKRLLQKIGSMPKITKKNKSALFVWVQEGSSENRLPQNPPVYHHRRSQNKKSQSGNTSCHLHRNIIIILYNYC